MVKIKHLGLIVILGLFASCSEHNPNCQKLAKIHKIEKQYLVSHKCEVGKVDLYVENSGSMDGYVHGNTEFKTDLFNVVKLLGGKEPVDKFFINADTIIRTNLSDYDFSNGMSVGAFQKWGGNRESSNIAELLEKIIWETDSKGISVFVSDCILDVPRNAIDFFGNCQVSIKNTFNEALSANPGLGVEIIKLDSKFDGYWYCGHNRELLKDAKRPYYIWIIGSQKYLAEFNKKVPIENIIGGIKEYSAYAAPQKIPFDMNRSTYVTNHSGKINVEILVNLRGSLQSSDLYKNTAQYKSANPSQVTVISACEITDASSPYSHVITLEIDNPETLKHETLTFSYPYLATWVSNSDDTTGTNVKENLDRTTGLMALIKGVAEAYKNSTTYGSVSFELKNK